MHANLGSVTGLTLSSLAHLLHFSRKDLALPLGDADLHCAGLAASVCPCIGACTPWRAAMDLRHVELAVPSCLVAQRHVNHAVVHHVSQGGHVCGLLSTVQGAGAYEAGGQLSCQGTRLPQTTGAVKERFHLRRCTTKARWQPEHDAIVLRQLRHSCIVHYRILGFRGCTHLLEDLGAEELGSLEEVDCDSLLAHGPSNLVSKLLDVAIEAVVHDADLQLTVGDFCCRRLGHRGSEYLALLVGNCQLLGARLPAAISTSKGAGTPGRAAVDFAKIELAFATRLISQRHIGHAMVHQLCDGSEVGGFLSTLLGASADEGGGQFAGQCPRCPQLSGAVEKRLHLPCHHAETRGHAKHETIIARKLLQEVVVQRHHVLGLSGR
mmetsp:Transcript_120113/g.285369  ORF Transcript_120113/g.285369 Transcript_120113/m.285369 type:complete len:380 (-) Transcript_120113:309-1448(-)